MPGYGISRSIVKNAALFDNYQCPYCSLLLKCAVQPKCGHWLCESCAEQLFVSSTPICPLPDCKEYLRSEAGKEKEYVPDQQVRREIEGMTVYCTNRQKGCKWEDRLAKLEDHQSSCDYAALEHTEDLLECPLADLGCSSTQKMTMQEFEQHATEKGLEHLKTIADFIKNSPQAKAKKVESSSRPVFHDSTNTLPTPPLEPLPATFPLQESGETPQGGHMFYVAAPSIPATLQLVRHVIGPQRMHPDMEPLAASAADQCSLTGEMEWAHQTTADELQLVVLGAGKFLWKIPDFSQRQADARAGVTISLYSRPFYTSLYGYRMRLRTYLNGDGIGKNTHMSLFFVIVKGEFDNFLQWPFKHNVTFKLINHTLRGRDVVDTFKPDPMSSSFRKPESDMNIASGFPCFVSHSQLRNGDFLQDDTMFIKCKIDTRE